MAVTIECPIRLIRCVSSDEGNLLFRSRFCAADFKLLARMLVVVEPQLLTYAFVF